MSESSVVTVGGAYKESDDFVPDPTDAFGTLDTSQTAGSAHGKVEAVTPIFEIAKAQNAVTAARALDPNDTEVDSSLVTLPQGMVISESGEQEARDRVAATADTAKSEPVVVGGPNPFQRAAAESGAEAGQAAQAESPSGQGGAFDGGTGGTHEGSGDADAQAAQDKADQEAAAAKAEQEQKDAAEKAAAKGSGNKRGSATQ